MLFKKDAVYQFVKEYFDNALLFAGLFSILIGLLYSSPMGSLICALGFFLGALLIEVSLVIHFELFSAGLRSREGIGNLLMCVGPLLIVGGAVSVLFAVPDWSHSYLLRLRTGVFASGQWAVVVTPLVRVYLGIAIPVAIAGVVLFVAGALIRLFDALY